jgi:hypothetical protein
MEPVSSAESLFAGVCQQALGFCSDKDGDGVIELGEGCLIVSQGLVGFCFVFRFWGVLIYIERS